MSISIQTQILRFGVIFIEHLLCAQCYANCFHMHYFIKRTGIDKEWVDICRLCGKRGKRHSWLEAITANAVTSLYLPTLSCAISLSCEAGKNLPHPVSPSSLNITSTLLCWLFQRWLKEVKPDKVLNVSRRNQAGTGLFRGLRILLLPMWVSWVSLRSSHHLSLSCAICLT